jgi:hypothetical protein
MAKLPTVEGIEVMTFEIRTVINIRLDSPEDLACISEVVDTARQYGKTDIVDVNTHTIDPKDL